MGNARSTWKKAKRVLRSFTTSSSSARSKDHISQSQHLEYPWSNTTVSSPPKKSDQQPESFDGEEPHHPDVAEIKSPPVEKVQIKTNQEFSVVPRSASQHNFAVLIHLKAPTIHPATDRPEINDRAPLDLVTVLDVSGSMAGAKLQLLKRAMRFVIQNLRPVDRLSVVVFSDTAECVFPLQEMSTYGRQQALEVVESLHHRTTTNIAAGLRKAVKVIEQRRENPVVSLFQKKKKKNSPVRSIMLLSDGRDTCGLSSFPCPIPVHSFGFGNDHDPALLHSISKTSGGTFSFVENVSAIQDAFAQCIGGLMTVVAQDLNVQVACVHQHARIRSIKSGSYASSIADDDRSGWIRVEDLYADELRDFLLFMDVDRAIDGGLTNSCEEEEEKEHGDNDDDGRVMLLKVDCAYKDPSSGEGSEVSSEEVTVELRRPRKGIAEPTMSKEVQREKDRVGALEAMAEAKVAADRGELTVASEILNCEKEQLETSALEFGYDSLELEEELEGMVDGVKSTRRYEQCGRACLLSGLSTHTTQRATLPIPLGSRSRVSLYQTPAMGHMLRESQRSLMNKQQRA